MVIDTERLREDLKNYFGTAMTGGSPLAMMDLVQVENATTAELMDIANRNGIDIGKYME